MEIPTTASLLISILLYLPSMGFCILTPFNFSYFLRLNQTSLLVSSTTGFFLSKSFGFKMRELDFV
jgi:hypothetical protein